MKIDKDSLDLLSLISRDFVLLTGNGQTRAYHVMSGDTITKDGFALYCDKHYGTIEVINDDGSKTRKNAGDMWWVCDLPGKRVVRRLVMEPTSHSEDYDPAGPAVFNRWHLLKLQMCEPNLDATPADCEIFLNHLMYISNGDVEGVTFFLNWLAQLYQKPEIKMPTAIMFYSKYGRIGKTILYKLLSRVFAPPLVASLNGRVLGKQFQDALEHKRIVVLNELARSDKLDTYEWFKNMISEEETSFEGKGKGEKEIRNFWHFIITTNNKDALPLMEEDGRVAIMRTDARRLDNEYYAKLHDWMTGPGPALVAGLLKNWKFPEGWDPYAPVPQTAATRQTQMESRNPITHFINQLIEENRPPFDKDFGTCIGLLTQLNALYPDICRQVKLNTRSLPLAMEALGYEAPAKLNFTKKNGVRTSTRWLCWRDRSKWFDTEPQELAQLMGVTE